MGPPSQGWTGESPLARQPGRAGGPGDPGGGGRSRGLRTAHSFPSNGDWRRSAPFEGKRYWERFLLPSPPPPPSPRATKEEDPPPSTLFYGLGLKIFACLELVGLLSVDDLCVRRGGEKGEDGETSIYTPPPPPATVVTYRRERGREFGPPSSPHFDSFVPPSLFFETEETEEEEEERDDERVCAKNYVCFPLLQHRLRVGCGFVLSNPSGRPIEARR